jgi:quinol monooxygenase YgiN
MVKHVVLFKFKPASTTAQRKELVAALNALPTTISEIKGWLIAESIPGRSARAMDVGLFSEFKDAAALERYVAHPDHRAVVVLVEAYCESRAAFDYES